MAFSVFHFLILLPFERTTKFQRITFFKKKFKYLFAPYDTDIHVTLKKRGMAIFIIILFIPFQDKKDLKNVLEKLNPLKSFENLQTFIRKKYMLIACI